MFHFVDRIEIDIVPTGGNIALFERQPPIGPLLEDISVRCHVNSLTAGNFDLQNLLNIYTFNRFQTDTPLQKLIKSTANKYLDDRSSSWFFIGGQSGAGKSHICTAIAGE